MKSKSGHEQGFGGFGFSPALQRELGMLLERDLSRPRGKERWTPEVNELVRYARSRGASGETITKMLNKAFPGTEWKAPCVLRHIKSRGL